MLIGALDFETQKLHTVVVRATDAGTPPRYDEVVVTIPVLDTNDNTPVCTGGNIEAAVFTAKLAEGTKKDTILVQMTATDKDSGLNANFLFSIVDKFKSLPFSINNISGVVSTTAVFDRETLAKYYLEVLVKDRGDKPRACTSKLTVTVTDINDHRPIFAGDVSKITKTHQRNATIKGTVVARQSQIT